MKQLIVSLLFISFSVSSLAKGGPENYFRVLTLMGSRFEITVVAQDSVEANTYIDMAIAEITRIEKLISSWDANSETSEINRNAGVRAVKVDEELYTLIGRCLELSRLTEGAFDISFASMDKIWRFDGSMTQMPSENEIAASIVKVGYKNIELDPENFTVFLKLSGMKIGFGAIGKGYAADKAKNLLEENGVSGGIINAAGDMTTWGKQFNGKDWQVAITNPMDKSKAYGLLPVSEGAVVTSGNYEKYVTFNGVRYTHIIDPRTGYPATGIISATVFAPKAELADALATAIFVMGIDTGLDFVNQIPKIECILIDATGKIFTSKNIVLETKSTSEQK
ncbi:thiamine biosynthesis lipoprotein [Ulvibacter sp. MAR_2010_11]|nr:FAD:protein FMN transferase [Ulvibacter sp. MAR_2010_11]PKA83508.1 thiamine biosynthesis lipoprotein [Ulvibacter sp. MAR_2010_11]